mgnify:CR=1 FL=1
MIFGSLHSKKIDWSKYESPNFTPNLINYHRWKTCGSATLSLLTHRKAHFIDKDRPTTQRHWSSPAFKKYLLNHGYTTIEVTKLSVTNCNWLNYPLTENHVIALNLRINQSEASWYVLFQNNLYHNMYQEAEFNPLFFLNKPPQNVILVHHPKWRIKIIT